MSIIAVIDQYMKTLETVSKFILLYFEKKTYVYSSCGVEKISLYQNNYTNEIVFISVGYIL